MPSDSDRLAALETEHKNLKEAIAKDFLTERTITNFSIEAVEVRVSTLEGEMVAFSSMTEGMKENIQFLVDAERDRTVRETTQREEAEKAEKQKDKTFFVKFMDEIPKHLATLVAGGLFALVIYLFTNLGKIGIGQ